MQFFNARFFYEWRKIRMQSNKKKRKIVYLSITPKNESYFHVKYLGSCERLFPFECYVQKLLYSLSKKALKCNEFSQSITQSRLSSDAYARNRFLETI